MLKSYFKIAWRNLRRNKIYTIINVTGLSIGIAAALMIFLIVSHETSYDQFHQHRENIYRLISYDKIEQDYSPGTPLPTRKALEIDFPDLEVITNTRSENDVQIDVLAQGGQATQRFKEEDGVLYTEPSFFQIFDFEWLEGNAQSALSKPNSVVLTKQIAQKYFGDYQKALGKTIRLDQFELLKVNGILADPPTNTDFPLCVIISYSTFLNRVSPEQKNEWGSLSSSDQIYVLAPSNLSQEQMEKQLARVIKKHTNENRPSEEYALIPQPLAAIHYDDRVNNLGNRTVPWEIIMALVLVGVFLVVVACINFVNLATVQAVNRSKEVGIRKVLGSNRGELMRQFLGETFIVVLLAMLLAIALVELALPGTRKLTESEISLNFLGNAYLWIFLVLLTLAITLLAGFYPALVLARFHPVRALKHKMTARVVGGFSLRRGLVILQFVLAQVLIIGLLVAIYQMQYISSRSMGFDQAAIINVPIPPDKNWDAKTENIESLEQKIRQISGVRHVTFSNRPPASGSNWYSDFSFQGEEDGQKFDTNIKMADTAYFSTYDIEFLAGRPYQPSDTIKECVVNETLLKKANIRNPEEILGKNVRFWGLQAKVVGVIKDFHMFSLHEPIDPLIITTNKKGYFRMGIKLASSNFSQTIAQVEKVYNQYYPENIFEYEFLDESIAEFYDMENVLLKIFRVFAGIGIMISCLGLYGLVSFMAVQKIKEVGIRKVLGATMIDICMIFYKEFFWLVLVAFAVAIPIGWYVMSNWLQNFAYRIELSWWIFAIAGLGVILIALLTISSQALRSARVNPVEALRDE